MLKIVIYLLINLVILFSIPIASIEASGDFGADYTVDYQVAPSGKTIVTQTVTLTNKKTNIYPKQYGIIIDTEQIGNVIARDSDGIINTTITQRNGKTEITLPFNTKNVGLGKSLTFTLRYENLEIAQQNGKIWEIGIPGVSDDPDIGTYDVSLQVPTTFGPNSYTAPLPLNGRVWTKDQMTQGGISAAYGTDQQFTVQLNYFLTNDKQIPVYQEIALPPDTAYQKITIQSLEPKPSNVRRDEDGNWLARYDLQPGANVRIEATLTAQIFLGSRQDWKEEDPSVVEATRFQPYWNTDDPKIQELASVLKSPRDIYTYVVNTLSYDYERVNKDPVRKGASEALKTPNESVCMEFTDLFIAIARARGIPAREVVGYAYTTNARLRPLSLVTDVLHSWPEYYDSQKQVWVPVDPTWGNTTGGINYFDKLDFNHIAFSIHSSSSTYPYPAGFYHEDTKTTKDVTVSFSDGSIPVVPGKLKTSIALKSPISSGTTGIGSVTVENITGVRVGDASIAIESSPIPYSLVRHETSIPPFAKFEYPIRIESANYLDELEGRIVVTVNGESTIAPYEIKPLLGKQISRAIAILMGVMFFILMVWRLRLWMKFRTH